MPLLHFLTSRSIVAPIDRQDKPSCLFKSCLSTCAS
nr:MAG TPA: hypothetical protein [Caudoviricetes sp.]